jgi:hypothetical protein
MGALRAGRVWLHGRAGHSRLVLAVVFIAAVLGFTQAPAGAASSPYTGTGYDASYPSAQCTTNTYPDGFAIIGLGGGRPFTTNACLTHEWKSASKNGTPTTPSLYFNTGYAGSYARHITSACTSAAAVAGNVPASPAGTSSHQRSTEVQAWEIGCSEAAYAAAQAPGTPAMWWADVETGNSWSTNIIYNDFAIDGIAYEISVLGSAVGFYSTPAMWNKIAGTGFNSTPSIDADWQPGSMSICAASGFSNSPVWLVQDGTVTATNGVSFSQDEACP